MAFKIGNSAKRNEEDLRVLLIGNNPIELSHIYERLQKLKDKNLIADIVFDLKALKERVKKRPSFIIIDDNLDKDSLRACIDFFRSHRLTKEAPITLIKNHNKEYFSEGVHEYILKDNINGESLYIGLINSLRNMKAQLKYYKRFKKRKTAIV